MDRIEAIEKVRKYKLLLKDHFQVDNVYLFGSYAKNTNKEDSDIDVAIVMSNIPEDFFSINPFLWKIRRQVDDRIEPVLIDKNNDQSGFLEEIKRSGIEV